MRSDTTLQPSVATSSSVVSQRPIVDHQVMDQFAHMKTMPLTFLVLRQEITGTAFYNYPASEVEVLEDFQTIKNEAVKH